MAYTPVANAAQHDFCLLGGQITPGIARIEGLSRKQKWDVKDGQGQKGAKITYVGDVLSKFRIKVTLWDDEQFKVWKANIDPVLQKSWNPPHPAIDIWHPDTVEKGIKSIVVEDVSQFVEIKDGWEITINVVEYREPKPDYGTPKGGLAVATGNAGTKEDKSNKELKELKKQAKFKEDKIAQRRARRDNK